MSAVDSADWMRIANPEEVPSPALLVYPERIEANLRTMIRIAGGPDRLRPHVKTHKLAEVVALKRSLGIRKFKAATIAEAELCAQGGAPDVLLAYQPVGPNQARLVALAQKFRACRFSCLVDDLGVAQSLGAAAAAGRVTLGSMLDLDVGIGRTGIAPGLDAIRLYRRMHGMIGLEAAGLHAFEGNPPGRGPEFAKQVDAAFAPVLQLRDALLREGLPVPAVVAGGTPSFSVLARQPGLELGAGTGVFWDVSYAEQFPHPGFQFAAVLLTRVVSKPGTRRLCLDLGHKAVASEMPQPRVRILGLEDAAFVRHNEEHLVVESDRAAELPLGSVLYAVPRHICPTVALHDDVVTVRDGRAGARWRVAARGRRITF